MFQWPPICIYGIWYSVVLVLFVVPNHFQNFQYFCDCSGFQDKFPFCKSLSIGRMRRGGVENILAIYLNYTLLEIVRFLIHIHDKMLCWSCFMVIYKVLKVLQDGSKSNLWFSCWLRFTNAGTIGSTTKALFFLVMFVAILWGVCVIRWLKNGYVDLILHYSGR